jgi:predicted deoxyguanosinetriphosphate triphosphohydrolase
MRSKDTKGRAYLDGEPEYRTSFQRDRDRILHTTAFRRLEYKTQVFINFEGDHFRTRLTHTLEVVQVARAIARALGLNEDLAETVALAHDLGHPPFGHAGERTLDRLAARIQEVNTDLGRLAQPLKDTQGAAQDLDGAVKALRETALQTADVLGETLPARTVEAGKAAETLSAELRALLPPQPPEV